MSSQRGQAKGHEIALPYKLVSLRRSSGPLYASTFYNHQRNHCLLIYRTIFPTSYPFFSSFSTPFPVTAFPFLSILITERRNNVSITLAKADLFLFAFLFVPYSSNHQRKIVLLRYDDDTAKCKSYDIKQNKHPCSLL